MDLDVSSDSTAVQIRRLAVVLAAVFVAVFSAARVAVLWEMPVGSGQPLWLASGISIGAALVVPRRQRVPVIAVAVAALTANSLLFVRSGVDLVIGDAAWSATEVVVGSIVMSVLFGGRTALGRTGTTAAAVAASFAIAGVSGGIAIAFLEPVGPLDFWLTWAIGNGLGMAAGGSLPLLLRGPGTWLIGGDPLLNTAELVVAVALNVGLVVLSFATEGQLVYVVIAGQSWLAVRFGPRISVPASLLVVIYACMRSASGAGPFGGGETVDLLNLEAFNTALVFSAVMVGRHARGIDRERRRNQAMFAAMPDIVTAHVGRRPVTVLGPNERHVAQADRVTRAVVKWMQADPPILDDRPSLSRTRHLEVEGEVRVFESRSVRVDRDTIVSVNRDITEPTRLVTDLRSARQRWQRIASTAYEGFLELDADNRIVFVTPRFAEMIAADIDDLLGMPIRLVFAPPDFAKFAHHARAVREGETVFFETDYRRHDGSRGWCIVSCEPLLDDDGRFNGAILFAAETTAFHEEQANRVEAEVRLASAEQLERERIARELHDGPLQTLVALSYQLHALTRVASTGSANVTARLEQLALESVRQMRSSLDDLVPAQIADGELGPALERAAARFASSQTPRLDVVVELSTALPDDVTLALYQIGREGIVNAILHAEATTIGVRVSSEPGGASIRVVDDGKGGATGARSPEGHLGLRTMHARAAELGGSCVLSAAHGGGTVVDARIPIAQQHRVAP